MEEAWVKRQSEVGTDKLIMILIILYILFILYILYIYIHINDKSISSPRSFQAAPLWTMFYPAEPGGTFPEDVP